MKIILVVGARPNFMKVAPLIRAISKYNNASKAKNIGTILVHTGQHYDYEMSQIFFEDLELPRPDIHLGIGSGTHAEQTGKIMVEFEKVLLKEKPDLVIVFGDVNSTLAAALAAVKLHIPVAHVEAGLRSYDKTMPEEINRLLTDHVSDYLFTTSGYDDDNLSKEGIPTERIFCVGNIMVDSLLHCKDMTAHLDTLSRLRLKKKGYALLTLHRPSNVDEKDSLMNIMIAITKISERIPVVFPAHPRTQKMLKELSFQSPITNHQLLITSPVGYLNFLNLEMNAKFVITDSGGIQVETTVLGVPCLTVLGSPVWTITHRQGTNTLVGKNSQKLVEEALKILTSKSKSEPKSPALWDGKAAERIVAILTLKCKANLKV
ncbi:MAG: UDP-N-acetylglucosamine 2-epimerase (non-hydrolyzing) [Chloroflexi bacterium]|nr:UDP-N-acetylglucosamine 2-epimerase (non-hydrolyzing) [Chloroflexota bacterium]